MTKLELFWCISKVLFAGAFMWVIFNLAIQIRIAVELSKGAIR